MLLLRRFLMAVGILSFTVALTPLTHGVAITHAQSTSTSTLPPPPPINTPTP
jgi:hypothetical protein